MEMFLVISMGGSGTDPSFSAAYGANIIRFEVKHHDIKGLVLTRILCILYILSKK